MKLKPKLIISTLLILFILTGCVSETETKNDTLADDSKSLNENSNEELLVGNDKDEHGCIGSAGYQWDEEKQDCVRPWEDSNSINSTEGILVGDDKDEHGCIGSAGYQWYGPEQRCVRIWEESAIIQCGLFNGTWVAESNECENILEKDCTYMGGTFNECGSACRNDPSTEVCTLNCIQVCKIE